jgi:low temperature requirement protein LtrA
MAIRVDKVAVTEVAQVLVSDHSVGGCLRFAGLFVPVLMAWRGFSLYADRFDTDALAFRAAYFAAARARATQLPAVPHS